MAFPITVARNLRTLCSSLQNEADLLRLLRRFLYICRKRRLVVSLPKSDFYLSEVIWCGHIIDAQVIRFHPKNIAGLSGCEPPRTAGELCE